MRIPSGVTDQYLYFVAVDATDLKTRETGLLTGDFTVVRSRNGGADATMTHVIAEVDGTTMPGVYTLLLDEDMTIAAGNDSEEMCFHITHASMAPVTRTIELYRPKITAGETLDVTSGAVDTVDALAAGAIITASIADASLTAAKFGAGVLFDESSDTVIVSSIEADVVTASALAADAVAEIQSGLATAAALATVDGIVDAINAVTAALTAATAARMALKEAATYGGTVSAVTDNGRFTLTADAGSEPLPTHAGALAGRGIILVDGNNKGDLREINVLNTSGPGVVDTVTDFSNPVLVGDRWEI